MRRRSFFGWVAGLLGVIAAPKPSCDITTFESGGFGTESEHPERREVAEIRPSSILIEAHGMVLASNGIEHSLTIDGKAIAATRVIIDVKCKDIARVMVEYVPAVGMFGENLPGA